MEHADDATIARLLETSLSTARQTPGGWENPDSGGGSAEGHFLRWLCIQDPRASVVEDVRRLRGHPLVAREVIIHGYLYDVKTGRLIEVPEATEVGRPAD
jgi:carbonic anhydrase